MKRLFLYLVMLPIHVLSQVTDDFADGNFTANPEWSGDVNEFKITSSTAVPEAQRPALQLSAAEAGLSYLLVENFMIDATEWQCWIKLSFNSSSGNNARIYLVSDQPDLEMPLHGYYIQVGGTDDSLYFCRQDSLQEQQLFHFSSAYTGNSTNVMRLRITREGNGSWTFYQDDSGGTNFLQQGICIDSTYRQTSFFGFRCLYTASNASKFYFDDFYIGPIIYDTSPPVVNSARMINPTEIRCIFSETVDQASAENVLSYNLDRGIGNPYAAIRLLDPSQVHLFFDEEMQAETGYNLHIENISDLSENLMEPVDIPMFYNILKPYDIVISEIMADPSPSAGLPPFEYIELFNATDYVADLTGWKLVTGSSTHYLEEVSMLPAGYLIVTSEDAVSSLLAYGKAIGLSSFSLSNEGTSLTLFDTTGQVICFSSYDPEFYRDPLKKEGGWSLERPDLFHPCDDNAWMVSENPSGGTPGQVNSVTETREPHFGIIKICCTGDSSIQVYFDNAMDSLIMSDVSLFSVDNDLGSPNEVIPVGVDFTSDVLNFPESFLPGILYELSVSPGLGDCTGNLSGSALYHPFGMPVSCDSSDVVINEVLFNPRNDCVDYVELFNRSEKVIDLDGFLLASVKDNPPLPSDTELVEITDECSPLLPGKFLVLTGDPVKVLEQYPFADRKAFLRINTMPSYNNDKGTVLLMNPDRVLLDGMNYTEDMHFPLLNTVEGVSLERIYPGESGFTITNWHSASQASGFGTPGIENSQFVGETGTEGLFSLYPEQFSPDGDGRDDVLTISYQLDNPGYMATILVFDACGRQVKDLVNNVMLGTSGAFAWDGTMNDRTPAASGIYVIYIEALNLNGKTLHVKKVAVIARRV